MQLISINVGQPRTVAWQSRAVTTSIFKAPIAGPVAVGALNLGGDQQSDLSVHGGVRKAIYVYPAEYYDYWRAELPEAALPWGAFGENFTTSGLLDDAVYVGDRLRVGSAEVVVTEPRLPCYKLGLKFGRADMVKRFLNSRRTGFYLAVTQPGMAQAGDAIELIERATVAASIADVVRAYAFDKDDRATLARLAESEALDPEWREYFREQLAKLGE